MYFFQPCPHFASFIFCVVFLCCCLSILKFSLLLLSWSATILYFFPHSLLTFPLLCPPLMLSSFFPLFNLLPSILQSLRVSHFFIILLFWTVYPYSLPLFICSLFLLSFISWLMYNSGITFYFRWRISLTIIGWLVWMRKASRSGKRPPSAFFSFTIQCV